MKDDRFVMVRSSRNVKRIETSARGDNAIRINNTDPPPYYFRHSTRASSKPRDDRVVVPTPDADTEPSIIIPTGFFENRRTYCTYCVAGILAILHCTVLINMMFPYPLHASCIVKWKFGEPCTYVTQRLRCQIMNWSSWNTCRQRDRNCLYTLKLATEENVISATHMTSNLRSHETIRIIFEETNSTCLATAKSVSDDWLTIFDYGANYCNLHNLVVGAGLDRHAKFLETTSDVVCTQFNMAVCG